MKLMLRNGENLKEKRRREEDLENEEKDQSLFDNSIFLIS